MRCAASVLGLTLACAACTYEQRAISSESQNQLGQPVGPDGTVPSLEVVAVRQCTGEADCGPGQRCELTDECFRTCHDGACDTGCTGVCRGHGGKCHKTPMPQPQTCEGFWHIAWDDEGCPRPPVCMCPDGTPQPIAGGCATTCSAPACADGHGLTVANVCYSACAPACRGDGDCSGGQHCVRQESCAVVTCASDDKDCRDGRECFGVCAAST